MKTFFLSIAVFIIHLSVAQGNLQFNQVILWKLNSQSLYPNNNDYEIQGTLTVPQNKVWRIDAASYNAATTSYDLTLDNFLLFARKTSSGGGLIYHQDIEFPIWLPSGTYNYLARWYCANCGVQTYAGSSVSIVEFNVIP
ncbi:MAG: hypothetical protein RL365_1679 [Bacteroidota bacterium]|jgi:hypothetical protein